MNEFDFQFYPTPAALARKAWALFQNKDFARVLEPSAGRGDLIKLMPGYGNHYRREVQIDACEIDPSQHPVLRELDSVKVVGMDFMKYGGLSIYSHVIMNPPFAYGVQHVLKAWEGIFEGEIVAIINAESLRNAFSAERKHLVSLIEQHGSVEFIADAFASLETVRKTNVEIALVYLRKASCAGLDIAKKVLDTLARENEERTAERLADGFEEQRQLILPNSTVENQVLAFNAAVKAMRECVMAEAKAYQTKNLIGKDVSTLFARGDERVIEIIAEASSVWVAAELRKRYLALKEMAWANLLHSSNVQSKLSSSAQKRMDVAFEDIKSLEFTVENISGFLRGLVESQGDIVREMACDVFDIITRYHTDNVVFYKGWASNDRHRTCGMRLKKTRFVLPGNLPYDGAQHLSCEAERRINDFDKVLAMLDGKKSPDGGIAPPPVTIASLFNRDNWQRLANGERLSATYMEVRFYPKAGTIHFFPKSQELMDKLNRMVGLQRQWLPPQADAPSEDFMRQYNDADKFDKEMRAALDKARKDNGASRYRSLWDSPLRGVFSRDDSQKAHEAIYEALTQVHSEHGIAVDHQLQHKRQEALTGQQLLIAA